MAARLELLGHEGLVAAVRLGLGASSAEARADRSSRASRGSWGSWGPSTDDDLVVVAGPALTTATRSRPTAGSGDADSYARAS